MIVWEVGKREIVQREYKQGALATLSNVAQNESKIWVAMISENDITPLDDSQLAARHRTISKELAIIILSPVLALQTSLVSAFLVLDSQWREVPKIVCSSAIFRKSIL